VPPGFGVMHPEIIKIAKIKIIVFAKKFPLTIEKYYCSIIYSFLI